MVPGVPAIIAENGRKQGNRPCSTSSIVGEWGYTESGSAIQPTGTVPAAAVGEYAFDASGNFSGTQYSAAGGNVGHDIKMGTYTVNRDCTGELRLSAYSESGALPRRSIWFVVYVDNARDYDIAGDEWHERSAGHNCQRQEGVHG